MLVNQNIVGARIQLHNLCSKTMKQPNGNHTLPKFLKSKKVRLQLKA